MYVQRALSEHHALLSVCSCTFCSHNVSHWTTCTRLGVFMCSEIERWIAISFLTCREGCSTGYDLFNVCECDIVLSGSRTWGACMYVLSLLLPILQYIEPTNTATGGFVCEKHARCSRSRPPLPWCHAQHDQRGFSSAKRCCMLYFGTFFSPARVERIFACFRCCCPHLTDS